ncbi:MAG: beta strand repeat-containing protein [Chthoniobacteraceae bacterium]
MSFRPALSPRPLSTSLARYTSAAAVCAALQLSCSPSSHAATVTWDGGGDSILWTMPANWVGDILPAEFDDVVFGVGTPGVVFPNGNQFLGDLTFNQNFTLGAYGDRNVLEVVGDVSVASGVTAVINSDFGGTSELNLSGGGKLVLNSISNSFTGPVSVSGAGTQLTVRSQGILPYINNVGHTIVSRTGQSSIGSLGTKTVTLQGGAEYRIVGNGVNPDGGNNIALGEGGGAINLPAAWQQMILDDTNQISGAGAFIKNGDGRVTIASQDYNLTGGLVLNEGIVELNRLQAGGGSGTRFSAFAPEATLTLNGGMLVPNVSNGRLDNAIVLNGGVLAGQGDNPVFGADASSIITTVNSGSILLRDANNPSQNRLPRFRGTLEGSGTLDVVGSTGTTAGILVFERTNDSTFSGTIRLLGNAKIENNPRQNTPLYGKTFGNATFDLAGHNPLLDLRDSGAATVVTNTLLNSGGSNYTTNTVNVTAPQLGALPTITVNRSSDTPASTNNLFNFGALNIGSQRVLFTGSNGYGLAFNTANLTGNAVFDQNGAPITFLNGIAESAAGQSITKVQRGNADLISAGAISVSNLILSGGTLQLRGANGTISTGFGGAAPTVTINGGSTLHLDSNGSSVGVTAGNNNNRVVDSATVRMLGNSTLRLTSANNSTTSETIGTAIVVGGHAWIDLVKSGTATAPVTLTLSNPSVTNRSTVNFTGTSLGATGNNSTRIILPAGSPAGFMGAAFHSANEWVKYETASDSGSVLGVTPFAAGDYTIDNAETAWTNTQHNKQTGANITMTADRSLLTLNLQNTAAQTLNTGGFRLALEAGGLISSGSAASGIVGTPAGVGSLTAGSTNSTNTLYAHVTNTLDIKVPLVDNGVPLYFVKSGTGTVRLTHQNLGVGVGTTAIVPFTDTPWASTLTGGWVINDGVLNVHRGAFLGGQSVTLNGGTLEINEPVAPANANSILPGWGNNIIVNGNAVVGSDDNGESSDGAANIGGNTLASLGSLTINNGATLGLGAYNGDIAFMGGATFAGRPTLNVGLGRGGNASAIINGAITGSGFDVVALNTSNPIALELGGTSSDQAHNTFDGPVVIYGGTVRLNKANGFDAIPNGTGAEDLVINGGGLAWGPGHHGDLSTTNNPNINNGNQIGLAVLSPAAIRAAGQNQINDNAVITMLAGSIGETDKIQNDVIGGLNMLNGTLNSGNSGEGKLEFGFANISGGAVAFNWATHLKFGTLNLLPGAPVLVLNNGFIARPTTLEIGSGGMSMAGSRIELSSGGLSNFAGGGSILKLGGDVDVNIDPLNSTSFAGQGIFSGIGGNMREFSNSYIDLMGGNRDFNIEDGVVFGISSLMVNGGFSKSGSGILDIQQYAPKVFDTELFSGPVAVNGGTLIIRSNTALGTSAGGVTINAGGTLKVDGNINTADAFTITGAGANVSGTTDIRELGALVVEQGQMTISGPVALGGAATLAPSITQLAGVGNNPHTRAGLFLTNAAGVTGTGTLTLSGFGDGRIAGGVNTTAGGLIKDGAGRWVIGGNSTYSGATQVQAGVLTVTANEALGGTVEGTTVYGGATLELAGGISIGNEALTLHGNGLGEAGALRNLSGANSIAGAVTLGSNSVIRSDSGSLTLGSTITGTNRDLTLDGGGSGSVQGAVALGSGAVTKVGPGTWTLGGDNTYTGQTRLLGGTLALDYGVNNGSKVAAGASILMSGGDLTLLGNAAAATTQNVGGLILGSGGGRITVNAGAGQAATLNLGAITLSEDEVTGLTGVGATLDFVLPATGAITTSTANVNGILGGYATVSGTDWATVTGGNIAAFTGYAPLSLEATTDTANSLVTTSRVQVGDVTTNSLKISGGAGVLTGASTLTLSSGGLLYTGAGRTTLGGTGLIAGATADSDLRIHTASGILDISSPLIGAGLGGLTKAGPGTLILRGTSEYTGPVNINEGTLAIVGPGGTTHPGGLGIGSGSRQINLNGGTFSVLAGNYDPNPATVGFVVNEGGGTFNIRDNATGGSLLINDGAQISGTGDLRLTGGGRLVINAGYPAFSGDIFVDQGILRGNNVASFGGRKSQLISLAPGSVFITDAGGAGIPNDIVANSAQIYGTGDNRTLLGDIHFTGVNTIGLLERDAVHQNRHLTLSGRITGSGTIDVFGTNQGAALAGTGNGNFLFLNSSSNTFEGTINLKPNSGLEARIPGSLGSAPGAITVNMDVNSRLLLRGPASGDYMANVVVNGSAAINVNRMAAGAELVSGDRTQLSINDLTVNNGAFLSTLSSGNNYALRVNGNATFNGDANVFAESGHIALVNGMTFASGTASLNKYGGSSLYLFDEANNATGTTIVHNGGLHLRGTDGALMSNRVELRHPNAALYVDNGDGANPNRISDTGTLVLGGGTLRVNGTEAGLGTVQAPGGHNQVIYTQADFDTSTALQLGTTFTRSTGSTFSFGTDNGTLGASNNNQFRAMPRITIPGQADVDLGDIIPWAVSGNEFVRYDGTTVDGGAPLGVIVLTNNTGSNYINDPNDANLLADKIIRLTGTNSTTQLAGSRTIRAIKMDGGDPALNATARRININGANTLTVDRGLIIHVNQAQNIGNSNTTTVGQLTSGNGELVTVVNAGTLEIGPGSYTAADSNTTSGSATALAGEVIIVDRPGPGPEPTTLPVALVKSGNGTLELRNLVNPSTYSGGTFVNQGTLRAYRGGNLGTGTITMNGGTLEIHSDEVGETLGGLGQNVVVNGNATLNLDNGPSGLATNIGKLASMGTLTIGGPYILQVGGFDGYDWKFTGASFTGTPIIDVGQGRTSADNANLSTTTIDGVLSGSGFQLITSNITANSVGTLQLAGTTANTYTGEVTVYDAPLQLNKTAGENAITGDLNVIGGGNANITWLQGNQMADTGVLTNVRGNINFNGQAETIAAINMSGGTLSTGANAVLNITGDVVVSGVSAANGFLVNDGALVTVGGKLKITDFGRVVLAAGGSPGSVLTLTGGLELTGSPLVQNNGGGANTVRLLGDVTTFAASVPSLLGSSDDSDTYLELSGNRTITVADGPSGVDLVTSTVIRDVTSPAGAGGLIKDGDGLMIIQGGGNPNTYSGSTLVKAGAIELFKGVNVNTLGNGAGGLTIGDGVGGAKADRVLVRNDEQLANGTTVNIASSGLLDLATYDRSETIAALAGEGAVDLGANSTFTVNGADNTVFAGDIVGGGLFIKDGGGTMELSGNSDVAGGTTVQGEGSLVVSGSLGGSVLVSGVSALLGDGIIGGPVTVLAGATLAPGAEIGILRTGSLDIQTGASFSLEINGTSRGVDYDSVTALGTVTLGGDLNLQVGFTPGFDTFTLILNDGIDPVVGTFAGLDEGALVGVFGGAEARITYFGNGDGGAIGNDVMLVVPEPTSATMIFAGFGMAMGLRRFRRRA